MKNAKPIILKPDLQKLCAEKINPLALLQSQQNGVASDINNLFDALMKKTLDAGSVE